MVIKHHKALGTIVSASCGWTHSSSSQTREIAAITGVGAEPRVSGEQGETLDTLTPVSVLNHCFPLIHLYELIIYYRS